MGVAIIIIVALIFFFYIFSPLFDKYLKNKDRYSNEEKGQEGEKLVRQVLGRSVEGVRYVFNDYRFYYKNSTVQIDHILVNKNGVFVIETKNYTGNISGLDDEREWTQTFANGNVENKFYNPVKQNYSHIFKLSKFLPYYIQPICLVIFVSANIDYVLCDKVISLNELTSATEYSGKEVLKPKEIDYIASILYEHQSNSITDQEHINNINKMKLDIENNICPRCGGNLVLRSSEYGDFYGCENYPNCTFKKDI